MTGDFFVDYAGFAQRWGWRFVPLALVFWVVFWPVAAVWSAITVIRRYGSLDRGSPATSESRVARLLSWYPPEWRARYGEEFSELLRDAIREGDAGIGLTLNVMRESSRARIAAAGGIAAAICWSLCWLPLFAQGIAPLIMKLAGTPSRSWFLALYLPDPYQWPALVAMITLGLIMFGTAARASSATRRTV
jgi:hypothetical protein